MTFHRYSPSDVDEQNEDAHLNLTLNTSGDIRESPASFFLDRLFRTLKQC